MLLMHGPAAHYWDVFDTRINDNKGCDTGPIFCSKAKFTSASYSTENMCYICTKLGALFSKLCSDVFTIDSK